MMQVHVLLFVEVCVLVFVLNGCAPESNIKNQAVRDRVCACSAGFSDDVSATLQAAYDKTAIKGGATADFKEQTQAIIFSELPEQDRLKAYQEYITCIEQNWNSKSSLPHKKYISTKTLYKNKQPMGNKNSTLQPK